VREELVSHTQTLIMSSPEKKSLYNDVIMDHIRNARNFRTMEDASRKAQGVNPLCGDSFTVFVRTESDYIAEASFQCECCGISMASASIMTETVRGKSLVEAKALFERFEKMLRDTGLEAGGGGGEFAVLQLVREFPSRVNCALLGWKTLAAALDGRDSVSIES
jgi:nitrogen fixation protein NifU and related proteins